MVQLNLRFYALCMALFSVLLVCIFSLTSVMYDWRTYWVDALGFFVFGNAYAISAGLMAFYEEYMPDPRRYVRLAFGLAAIPTAIFFYAFFVLATSI
ncbi:hypothetical protein [Flaviaesturariibacter amylovorans]|uniref:Uncharacterized protein n=1 Tax=Flaviaesturariibacter amylovorans TaxID=1084520 RepID=A0ABP8HR71_9BACT